jgi:hypothetical protein
MTLRLKKHNWLSTPKRLYEMQHPALPYEIELELPMPVITNIYLFLTPKYMQTPTRIKIQQRSIDINHRITKLNELLLLKKQRKEKRIQQRKELIENLTKIIDALEKSLER